MRALIAVAVLFATAQTWMVETVRDEFTGEVASYLTQIGNDQQLALDVVCDSDGIAVALSAGPAARWSVFENGDVDLRFDDGSPVPMRFHDGDTTLLAVDLDVGLLTDAETVTVQARYWPGGLEVDTLQMLGLAAALESADCLPR